MAEKKMTKKDFYGVIREMVADRADLVEFIDHELELLNKKSSKRGLTATQKENVELMDKIYNALVEVGNPVTISELQASVPEMAEYSNQKLSALLKKLVESNRVVKTIEKKKSYFSANVD